MALAQRTVPAILTLATALDGCLLVDALTATEEGNASDTGLVDADGATQIDTTDDVGFGDAGEMMIDAGPIDSGIPDLGTPFTPTALDVTPSAGGIVHSDPPGIDCGLACRASFSLNSIVTLTATPDPRYRFEMWGGDCMRKLTEACDLVMSQARSVGVRFVRQHTLTVRTATHSVVVSIDGGIDCGEDCSEAYDEGAEVTLEARPTTGYVFAGWLGDCQGVETCVVDMTGPRTVIPTFAQVGVDLLVSDFELPNQPLEGTPLNAPAGAVWVKEQPTWSTLLIEDGRVRCNNNTNFSCHYYYELGNVLYESLRIRIALRLPTFGSHLVAVDFNSTPWPADPGFVFGYHPQRDGGRLQWRDMESLRTLSVGDLNAMLTLDTTYYIELQFAESGETGNITLSSENYFQNGGAVLATLPVENLSPARSGTLFRIRQFQPSSGLLEELSVRSP